MPQNSVSSAGSTSITAEYLRPRAAAVYINSTVAALATWRYRSVGPKYIKRGRSIWYRRADLDTWLSDESF